MPPAPNPTPRGFDVWSAKVDDWILRYSIWLELALLAAGAVLRVMAASGIYLNPDEALHFDIANQTSPLAVYRVSLLNAHPPLYFLLLYFWQLIGNSEVFLRMPGILAGTALISVMGRWLSNVAGKAAGFAAMLLIAFSPPLIFLSSEVRGYSLLLLFMALALYCLERAFALDSAKWMTRFAIFLLLADLTHYSAVWFTITVGAYVLLRARDLSRNTLVYWAGSQLGIALVYVFLYVTHISKLHGGGMEREATDGWLRVSYFHPDVDTAWEFFSRGTVLLFQFLFSDRTAGQIALGLCVATLVGLAVAGFRKRMESAGPLSLAVLLAMPFVLTAAAAGWQLYPYGGSRHDAFLMVFAVAGVTLAVAALAGWRCWLVLVAGLVILPIWNNRSDPMPQSLPLANQRVELMKSAVDYIHASVPPGSMIYIDTQTSALVPYYICRDAIMTPRPGKEGYQEAACGQYRFLIAPLWMMDSKTFTEQITLIRKAYGIKTDEYIWVFNGGWGVNLLDLVSPQIMGPAQSAKAFGPSISVFQVASPPAPEPANTIRVNAGGDAFVDSDGRNWAADTGYSGGNALGVAGAISGTTAAPLYANQRQSAAPFRYEFELPNQDYLVRLRFAEIWGDKPGQRVFNVALNDKVALPHFDVAAAAGTTRKAVDKEFTVHVTAGRLSIGFTPVRLGALVSGIEVLPK